MAGKVRISLRDVGRAAGVSHVTVSLALRNHPEVSLKTRKRIQELAAALGYRPDPMLRALAEYRRTKEQARHQGVLAWLNYYADPSVLATTYEFSLFRKGAETRANELGYKLAEFTPTADKIEPERLKRILATRGIQGLLLPPQPRAHAVIDFDFSGFAAVTFGFTLQSPQLHVISNVQFRTSMIAFRKLHSYGFKRIGFVISRSLNERTDGAFLGGFLSEQALLPEAEQVPIMIWDAHSSAKEEKRFRSWQREHRPDALITGPDDFQQITEECRKLHIRIPDDLSLASLTVGPPSLGLAGMDQNAFEIGRVAVETLVGMLYRNQLGVPEIPLRVLVEGAWRDGPTVRKPA
jgi:DNA-binding LacI/PurR family transcriptional regulator